MREPTAPAAVAETHSAVVFFVGDRAYKLRKPIDLGFVDYSERKYRYDVSRREVELNRRLSPDVYLGVADVTAPDGAVCDHLVVMRRLPQSCQLSSRVLRGEALEQDIDDIAELVARFHASCGRSELADLAMTAEATRQRWEANTAEMIRMSGRVLPDAEVGLVHGLACRYLDGRGPLFQQRITAGRGVDGHGDLLADDIFLLDDAPRILDCLEFDDALRVGDGLADIAFLAMDLERLGRPDLADRLLGSYAAHARDSWPSSLAHHYIAYRAQVRAKVASISALQGDHHAAAQGLALLGLAAAHLEAGAVRLVMVGGLPGTGKSTLAAGLAGALNATLLQTDAVRTEVVPIAESSTPGYARGRYSERAKDAVYETLLARAGTALGLGENVVLDASWISRQWRAQARELASRTSSDLIQLRCSIDLPTAAARLLRRASNGEQHSEATPEVAIDMACAAEPWPEALVVDTHGPAVDALEQALAHVGIRPSEP